MIDNSLIYRKDGYSTDTFFLIRTELENSILKKRVTAAQQPDCKSLVDRCITRDLIQIFPTQFVCKDFNLKLRSFTGNQKRCFAQDKYIKYFGSIKDLEFYQENALQSKYSYSDLTPIVVKKNSEFVGLIMPVNIDN